MHEAAQPYTLFAWVILFPAFMVAVWLFATTMTSYLGGWHALSLRYQANGIFGGQKWNYQSGQMRAFTNYNGCLTVGASPAGLYLRPFALFRFQHPALFIPWHEIRVERKRYLFREMTALYLSSEYSIPLRISNRLAEKIQKAAGDQWPAEMAWSS